MKKILLLFAVHAFFFNILHAAEELMSPVSGTLSKIYIKEQQAIYPADLLFEVKTQGQGKVKVFASKSGFVSKIHVTPHQQVRQSSTLLTFEAKALMTDQRQSDEVGQSETASLATLILKLYQSSGIAALVEGQGYSWTEGLGRLLMIFVGGGLIYLAIKKGFEPLLLLPIGFGCVLSNIPLTGVTDPGGVLYYAFNIGIHSGVFPLLIFMGVGALTDFGPLIANPKTALLGSAAQIGIFATLIGALLLTQWVPWINFSIQDAASIGIIGGADGPTAIFLANELSPRLLGSIAVAAYSYMALVPIIQPPIMKALTTHKERQIPMVQQRDVSKTEKIIFPLVCVALCALLLPSAIPLVGMLMFGNLLRESGVVQRLSQTAQNELINIVTIFLGLGVGSKLSADQFLNLETAGILILGAVAFSLGTAGGILMAKLMNYFSKTPINPLIGAAGVSAVPMAARVVHKVGAEANPQNFLLMHAMGPNVAGVLGSAVAAGLLLALL